MPEVTNYSLSSKVSTILWEENTVGCSENIKKALKELYSAYLKTQDCFLDRWGVGRSNYGVARHLEGMKPFNVDNHSIGKKIIWIFLLSRLYIIANDEQKAFIKDLIITGMKELLDLLSADIDNKTLWHPDGILFIFSIELVHQLSWQEACGSNATVGESETRTLYRNEPILGCSLIFWTTSSDEVFTKFINLMEKVSPNNRTWEMLFNCLKELKSDQHKDISNCISRLYGLMKDTPLIEKRKWYFTPYHHKSNFTYYLKYTKKEIYSQIKEELSKQQLILFLKQLFNTDVNKDSLIEFMYKGGIFKATHSALKYLYKLAADYLYLQQTEHINNSSLVCIVKNSFQEETNEDTILEKAKELENKEKVVNAIMKISDLKLRFIHLYRAIYDSESLVYKFLRVPRNAVNIITISQIERIEYEYQNIKPFIPILLVLAKSQSISASMQDLLVRTTIAYLPQDKSQLLPYCSHSAFSELSVNSVTMDMLNTLKKSMKQSTEFLEKIDCTL